MTDPEITPANLPVSERKMRLIGCVDYLEVWEESEQLVLEGVAAGVVLSPKVDVLKHL